MPSYKGDGSPREPVPGEKWSQARLKRAPKVCVTLWGLSAWPVRHTGDSGSVSCTLSQTREECGCTSEEILTLGLTRDTLVSALVHTRRVKASQRAGWGLQKGVPRRV